MFAASKTDGVSGAANYIEDVFSTYLYAGTSASQTITNNIDLSTKGGLVWLKNRTSAVGHKLFSPATGMTYAAAYELETNVNDGFQGPRTNTIRADTTGFSLGTASNFSAYNLTGQNYASWTFRKQPKFFDVVTFTSDGTTTQAISHSLGSAPGCILIKRTDATQSWIVWHRGNGTTNYYTWSLNSTAAAASTSDLTPYMTSTSFQPNRLDDYLGNRPVTGGTYVAYLFAHDAGGFGLTGTDNVISCGSFTTDGSGNGNVTLAYEPQFVLLKRTDATSNWAIYDNMRGWFSSTTVGSNSLAPNLSSAETTGAITSPNATGFSGVFTASSTFIYIAIRRGPMKVPTSGTSVFAVDQGTASGSAPYLISGFPVDFAIRTSTSSAAFRHQTASRLTGSNYMNTTSTAAEASDPTDFKFDYMNGWGASALSTAFYSWMWQRAPGFMDAVCYTGTGVARTINHNLGVVPELMIVKQRSAIRDWSVYSASTGATNALYLNTTAASSAASIWNSTAPTSSVFSLAGLDSVNASGGTYVAYLFATCAGVSKVGSYTGNGSSQTINCGFTGGARYVLIKRTDSTGDWYVWDTARGIVAGNDPHLSLNTTAAEVTTDDTIDTDSTGFIVNQLAATNVNVTSATYIFLAIA